MQFSVLHVNINVLHVKIHVIFLHVDKPISHLDIFFFKARGGGRNMPTIGCLNKPDDADTIKNKYC